MSHRTRSSSPHVHALAGWAGLAGMLAAPSAQAADVRPAPPPEVRAWQTGLVRADRLQHLSLSWTLGLAVGLATREPAAAMGTSAGLAFAKEIADRHRTGFDVLDLAAGLIGGAAAGVATNAWRR